MRRFPLSLVTAAAVVALATPVAAQKSGSGKGPTKAPTTSAHATKGGSASGAGKTTKSTGGSASSTGKTAKSTGSSHAGSKKGTTSTDSTTTTTTTTTGTGTTETTNALATKISKNPELLAKVTGMLPPGVSLDDASKDFPNQGLFIAALNASKNRPNVDFLALKEAMTVDGLSLGQAVKKVQSTAPVAPTTGGSTTGGSTTGTGTSTGSDSSGTGTTGGTTTDTSTSGTTTQK